MPHPRHHLSTVLLAILGGVCSSAAQPATSAPGQDTPTGFDHLRHESRVSVAGGEAIPCQRCHDLAPSGRLRDRPGHQSCYGECHGSAPARYQPGRRYPIADDRRPQCQTCHPPSVLREAEHGHTDHVSVPSSAYRSDAEHGIQMSHAKHDGPSQALGGCQACHPQASAPPRAPGRAATRPQGSHLRCLPCHGSAVAPRPPAGGADPTPTTQGPVPPMSECRACHTRAFGPRTRPYLAPGAFPVSTRFSHRSHADREAIPCRQCHTQVATTEEGELAAPTMGSCASCHDGAKAFATTGTHCQRCHIQPEDATGLRAQRLPRFDHERHGVATAGCDQCHRLDAQGFPRPPAESHQPCARCHADQFAALQPTICGVCHIGSEPWRPLHLDRPPPRDTGFGARYSHLAHQREHGVTRGCDACHGTRQGVDDMRLARDHQACGGQGCHQDDAGAPTLGACAQCHVAGLRRERLDQRRRARFSVRGRFVHAPHQSDPRTGERLPCTTCHDRADQASRMDDMPTPAKDTCVPCHDGRIAFKVTGHGCVRCHESRAAP